MAMFPITLTSHVGPDGILTLRLPLGATEANRAVRITVSPAEPLDQSSAEWRSRLLTIGGIDDPTFYRHEQGELEQREELP